jgi:hypothetical protein
MIDMDELLRGLQDIDPLWSVALVALALLVLIAALERRSRLEQRSPSLARYSLPLSTSISI